MTAIPRRVFFDASVLFSGCHAPGGGSGLLIDAAIAGILEPVVSQLVIEEARRALQAKSKPRSLLRLGELLAFPDLEVAPIPTPEELKPFIGWVASKDCHVVASAVRTRCQFLITLDRMRLLIPSLQSSDLPIVIANPAQFLAAFRAALESEGV